VKVRKQVKISSTSKCLLNDFNIYQITYPSISSSNSDNRKSL